MSRAHAIEDYLQIKLKWTPAEPVSRSANAMLEPEMVTLCIDEVKQKFAQVIFWVL